MRNLAVLVSAALLAACTSAQDSPSRQQRAAAADDLNPSGRPTPGPPGLRASSPPGDSSMIPLFCHQEPPGTVCTRNAAQ